MNNIYFCEYCIEAIRSHGEKLYVGEPIYQEEDDEDVKKCHWCEEFNDTLYECKFY